MGLEKKSFYSLSKNERAELVAQIQQTILLEINSNHLKKTIQFFSDEDTYIRKAAYLSVGRIYFAQKNIQAKIISVLKKFKSKIFVPDKSNILQYLFIIKFGSVLT